MSVETWITSAAVAAAVSIIVTIFWERRKLGRKERADAYADFLSVFSKRWKAFADRDGAKKRGEAAALDEADARVNSLRDELYDAYSRIQILGSQKVVEQALACLRLSDDRNRAFKMPGAPGVAADARAAALSSFTKASREDLSLKALDTHRLKAGFTSMSGALLPEVE